MYVEPQSSRFPRKLHQRRLTALTRTKIGGLLAENMAAMYEELGRTDLVDSMGDFVKLTVGYAKVFEADYDAADNSIANVTPVKLEQLLAKGKVDVLSLTARAEAYEAALNADGEEIYPAGVSIKIDKLLIERNNSSATSKNDDFGFTVKSAKKQRLDKPRRTTPPAGKQTVPNYTVGDGKVKRSSTPRPAEDVTTA